MTDDDIVHRIRIWVGDRLIDDLLTEAADEIERLRAQIEEDEITRLRTQIALTKLNVL